MIPLPPCALRRALEPLRGKILRLEVPGLPFAPQLTLDAIGLRPAFGKADVTVRASLADYAALALRREDPDTLFFSRRLVIEGDTALGLIVKNALDSLG
jgi:O2-independent ubiquinone biosynthesis accessory factor UbiT